eukprot:TRINITY_DN6029_c0_g1_i2.p1 TRINITY_DN6029_c0_g1~~TRINITY_DN6029_c0_g1_i2.p1  ORF type:complete len:153 (+),score=18.61 TRINITY_DN6029_c0_g1_i2:164-622(+)
MAESLEKLAVHIASQQDDLVVSEYLNPPDALIRENTLTLSCRDRFELAEQKERERLRSARSPPKAKKFSPKRLEYGRWYLDCSEWHPIPEGEYYEHPEDHESRAKEISSKAKRAEMAKQLAASKGVKLFTQYVDKQTSGTQLLRLPELSRSL